MSVAKTPKFSKLSKGLGRVVRAAKAVSDARERLDDHKGQVLEQLAVDIDEMVRRQKRRAALAGSWMLSRERSWFDDPGRQSSFLDWMNEVDTRADDLALFDPDADDDLLTTERVVELAREAQAVSILEHFGVDPGVAGVPGGGSSESIDGAQPVPDPPAGAEASTAPAGSASSPGPPAVGGDAAPPAPASVVGPAPASAVGSAPVGKS